MVRPLNPHPAGQTDMGRGGVGKPHALSRASSVRPARHGCRGRGRISRRPNHQPRVHACGSQSRRLLSGAWTGLGRRAGVAGRTCSIVRRPSRRATSIPTRSHGIRTGAPPTRSGCLRRTSAPPQRSRHSARSGDARSKCRKLLRSARLWGAAGALAPDDRDILRLVEELRNRAHPTR